MTASQRKINENILLKTIAAGGVLLIITGMLFPVFFQNTWFNTIMKIREAITTGDSGHLILASASLNSLCSIQSTLLYMGSILLIFNTKLSSRLKSIDVFLVSLVSIVFLHWMDSLIFEIPWEPVSTLLALIISLFLFEKLFVETYSFIQVFIVSVQVFFAFQWLNIMPYFSSYRFGRSDVPYSVKISGIYLNADTVLNFAGFAFFIPFIISAFITATLFISYSRNIHMMRENHIKENEIRDMRAKALENQIYQEVKSLVHDLKTPLVTIRGLNSLMVSENANGKLAEYSERIENSVAKMSDMISSFLYEYSRQKLKASDLISYIRAQLPLEDEKIRFSISIEEDLPDIYINKIRIARAVINVLENAIVVPCKHSYKMINFDVRRAEKGINIIIKDNGIGIDESNLTKIWEIGYSTNNTSGLGLPFAKRIIEDNAGTIEVGSQRDFGTTVTIFLPSVDNFEDYGRGEAIEKK
ncbi:MAG TPA: HAMP domain-containing sensor histidine kinase [Bacillota bacterium]|nr:HAMP domain-containing sensor histidine kinase [Clostridiaceae bacterium]HNR05041.1 HAMP domain-containing sensor histidine kinase [Bacillota bacterium]HNT02331.1 HAMP domain-containing sensor histidine kinase [Bacillota bacterium]HPA54255.1 HAMP domain-containing sensor histidine kinase [Bacillota bacterium]HPX68122.1 HAMP domain-containing sensor histidine kinase [Bacillota bacterium]